MNIGLHLQVRAVLEASMIVWLSEQSAKFHQALPEIWYPVGWQPQEHDHVDSVYSRV